MSILTFPTTFEGIGFDPSGLSIKIDNPALKHKVDGGYSISRPRYTKPAAATVTCRYVALTQNDVTTITNFWNSVAGGSKAFMFTEPASGVQAKVRFANESLDFKYVGHGAIRAWDVELTFETVFAFMTPSESIVTATGFSLPYESMPLIYGLNVDGTSDPRAQLVDQLLAANGVLSTGIYLNYTDSASRVMSIADMVKIASWNPAKALPGFPLDVERRDCENYCNILIGAIDGAGYGGLALGRLSFQLEDSRDGNVLFVHQVVVGIVKTGGVYDLYCIDAIDSRSAPIGAFAGLYANDPDVNLPAQYLRMNATFLSM